MTDNEAVCYEQTFLKEVIVRIDFGPAPLSIDDKGPSDAVRKAIQSRFPIAEPQTVLAESLQFGGPTITREQTKKVQWVFHALNRAKNFSITSEWLQGRYHAYVSYEDLRADIETTLSALSRTAPPFTASRLGLRYINVFPVGEGDPLKWVEYFHESLVAALAFPEDGKTLARALGLLEFNFSDVTMRLQYGIANPDHPAPIRRREFILDLDGFFAGLLEGAQLLPTLDSAHTRIQEAFERSITSRLRDLMHAK